MNLVWLGDSAHNPPPHSKVNTLHYTQLTELIRHLNSIIFCMPNSKDSF